MKTPYHIVIAGAGGIAEAVAVLLTEWNQESPILYIGDKNREKAKQITQKLTQKDTDNLSIEDFYLPEEGVTPELETILKKADIILDCLPGSQAPRIAKLALDFKLHYANLTEHVAETEQIKRMAQKTSKGFVLQTGLAPGYINILANGLFQEFCKDFGVLKVDKLQLRVGALSKNAIAPHFYGFTWSTAGVATEYLKDTWAIRDFKKTALPSLAEIQTIIIDGITYEESLTSGGAADLPDAFLGKVKSLDYKTLRHPGHYSWVKQQIDDLKNSDDLIQDLQIRMESLIPHLENDQVVLYVAVEGKDQQGFLRRREISKRIEVQKVGHHQLRAIQVATAAPLAQAAHWLLTTSPKGIVLQSQIDPIDFLNGHFIKPVYGSFL